MQFKLIRRIRRAGSRESEKPRIVVIHNHVFKNAGTTLDWALKRTFGNHFVDHRDNDLMRQGADYLGPYLQENPNILALSTHHLVFPLPQLDNIELKQLMMFRHPIERVSSVYHFERNQIIDTPGTIHARKLSLGDYITWRMRSDVGATIRNNHARKMLPPRKLGQERLEESEMRTLKSHLLNLDMLGLVERFDESLVLFEEFLRRYFPKIDLSYVPQNIRQAEQSNLEGRLAKLKLEIGEDVFEMLEKNNEADLQLYRWAKLEFQGRVLAVPNVQEKLSTLGARCRML